MPGFDLKPVAGGDPIHLPEGETVLGRGPLLGISDKRVSRRHGLLENLNGQLRLKPTHINPCFSQLSLDAEPQALKKDCWYPLLDGALFSLLPGECIYKVVYNVGEGDSTPRNSQMFQEEEELPIHPHGSPEPEIEPPPAAEKVQVQTPPPPAGQDMVQNLPSEEPALEAVENNQQDKEEANSPNTASDEGDSAPSKQVKDENNIPPPVPKKRVLPPWMMTIVASSKSPSSTSKAVKKGKRPAQPVSSGKRGAANRAGHTAKSLAEESEHSEAEETPRRKRRRKMSKEDTEAQSEASNNPLQAAKASQLGESSRAEVSDESDNFSMEVEEEGGQAETTTATRNTTKHVADISEPQSEDKTSKNGRTANRAESVGSNGGSALPKTRLRTPCPYGKDCYRKNPVHFQECSHPGDSDYEDEEEEEEEDTDQPECPYGTDCYRKNPLHRKEYKHTKRPAWNTRAVPKKPAADEEEDDDFGDDDSFINDDSEDVGDDSDYVPPDSDDSGKEDVRRLRKEAKAFQKRGK